MQISANNILTNNNTTGKQIQYFCQTNSFNSSVHKEIMFSHNPRTFMRTFLPRPHVFHRLLLRECQEGFQQ